MNLVRLYGYQSSDVTRDFFFNVGGSTGFMRWGLLLFLAISLFFLITNLQKRKHIWHQGKAENRTKHFFLRSKAVVKYVLFHARIIRHPYPGVMHVCFFLGCMAFVFLLLLEWVQNYFVEPFFHIKYLTGKLYLFWTLAGDLTGIILFLGLLLAVYRRYVVKPNKLDTQKTDTFALLLVFFVLITGGLDEAFRIVLTGFPDFEIWSPVGYSLAHLFSWCDHSVLKTAHYANWWVHSLAIFSFIGLSGSGKLGHITIGTMNIYRHNIDNENPNRKYKICPDMLYSMQNNIARQGVSVHDFTWKHLMELDACTRCGRCQDVCPAWLTDKPLSPKNIIVELKRYMDSVFRQKETLPFDNYISREEVWSCTTCGACMEACPVLVEHLPKIIKLRSASALYEQTAPSSIKKIFGHLEKEHNIYGKPLTARLDWLPASLQIKPLAEKPAVEYLFFAGCSVAYDPDSRKAALDFLKIMRHAGIEIGVLGLEENCCGDMALRTGNDYLFKTLAMRNLALFKHYNVKKIITTCPHGYNLLKKEYKLLAKSVRDENDRELYSGYRVYHHTEILDNLISEGKIILQKPVMKPVTYHDSCLLGRYNHMYDLPRKILKNIPGIMLLEMNRNKSNAFCCGAGGGMMWCNSDTKVTINEFRAQEAYSSGAEEIVTTCPFCKTMLQRGIERLAFSNMNVVDITEYVSEAMGLE